MSKVKKMETNWSLNLTFNQLITRERFVNVFLILPNNTF